jgi:hypothetical protein
MDELDEFPAEGEPDHVTMCGTLKQKQGPGAFEGRRV